MKIAVLKNSVYFKKHAYVFSLRFPKLHFNPAIVWNIPGGYCKSKGFFAAMQSIPIGHLHIICKCRMGI